MGIVRSGICNVESAISNRVAPMNDVLRNGKLKPVIECLLFVASEPISAKDIAEALDLDEVGIEEAIQDLRQSLAHVSGLQVVRVAGGYQLCTRPEYSEYVSLFLRPSPYKLSKAALETLAIIAYQQPVTQPEVEAIRGVNADGVMKNLLDKGLIKEVGRRPTVGRPILYATTEEFLQHFGINDLTDLPDVDELPDVQQIPKLDLPTGEAPCAELVEAPCAELVEAPPKAEVVE